MINRLKELINGYDKQLESIEDMRLGFLLKRASYGTLNGLISRDKAYIVDKFSFSINAHDTGVSVVVNLIASDGEKLNIINGTYWYNESQYGFNKFYRLNGVWDEPLELAIEKIRTLEIDKLNSDLSRWISELEALQQKESDTKSKFESEFI